MSTKLSGLPFSGPIGATRVAHVDGQWVAFPTHEELERATFDMVVAGRVLPDGDVAIMMVEAEATEHTIALIAGGAHRADRGGRGQRPGGRQAGHPRAVPGPERAGRGRGQAGRRVPGLPGLRGRRRTTPSAGAGRATRSPRRCRSPARPTARRPWTGSRTRSPQELARRFEGREKELRAAFRSLTKKRGPRTASLRDQVRIDGRGPRDIRALTAEVGVLPAGARLGAVRARRDPDPGRHHAEHARAWSRRWTRCRPENPSATCTTTTSRRTRPVRPAGSARRSGARSATARSPSGR